MTGRIAGPGHNNGPTMEPGTSWRRHCWGAARSALLPHLPVEVVRLRVRRAAQLGLDYRTYASVRASSGHDVVAFLFSSNALRVFPATAALPEGRAAKLAAVVGAGRIGLAQGRLTVGALLTAGQGVLDASHPAPRVFASFPDMRDSLRTALGRLPPDQVVLVGDTASERDWCAAGRLAAYLPAAQYFGQHP